KTIPASKKILIVFSDGQTYQNDMPIDPDHFELQRRLIEKDNAAEVFPIYYVNFQEHSEDSLDKENEAETIVTLLCKQTGGAYYPVFNWLALSNKIFDDRLKKYADFRLKMLNPDYKIYRGSNRWLSVDFCVSDSILFSGKKSFTVGHHYHPIVVKGKTIGRILVQGCFFALCFLMLVYLIFQFIVPAVRYQLFKKKYIVKYTGKNMAIRDIQVEEVCYYCKAPFEEGEEIVVKCEHAMHKTCWDENEYKCPEYGRKCQHGSHYYNQYKPFDLRNASFYMNWILAGTLAGVCAWSFFLFKKIDVGYDYLVYKLFELFNVDIQTNEAIELLNRYEDELYYTPFYGLYVSFFLTLFLSILSSHGVWWWKRSAFVLIKAVLAGIEGYLSFVIIATISLALNLRMDFLLIDWIPWILNGFVIAYLVSYQTDIKLYNALKGAVIAAIFGIGTMYLWEYTHDAQMDMRNLLLLSIIIYCIGLAVSLAANSPQSERYFLRVEGAVKTMDIAIYKWMKTQYYNRRVTIGRSVDCNLQVTWDINSDIAPIQAEIVSERGNLYLIALEIGVEKSRKPVKIGKKIRLYHGDKFTIGQTIFTYIEKDV
ncbi:MAG: FHA domain-containing protein, partial [Parabacteroides sp.]|nr:FHA domain-containing protein [Parabacteroides sp.]